jgi:hypothetical protein
MNHLHGASLYYAIGIYVIIVIIMCFVSEFSKCGRQFFALFTLNIYRLLFFLVLFAITASITAYQNHEVGVVGMSLIFVAFLAYAVVHSAKKGLVWPVSGIIILALVVLLALPLCVTFWKKDDLHSEPFIGIGVFSVLIVFWAFGTKMVDAFPKFRADSTSFRSLHALLIYFLITIYPIWYALKKYEVSAVIILSLIFIIFVWFRESCRYTLAETMQVYQRSSVLSAIIPTTLCCILVLNMYTSIAATTNKTNRNIYLFNFLILACTICIILTMILMEFLKRWNVCPNIKNKH